MQPSPDRHQVIGHPRRLWPREADFTGWLARHLDHLAPCLGVRRLECTGWEVVIGERWTTPGRSGYEQLVGGMRLDLRARDEHGRLVIVETQFGPADHTHLGQLITYATATTADLAVWMVADTDPMFSVDHLATLAELNTLYAGRREFHVIAVTAESVPAPVPPGDEVPLEPRLHRVDLLTQKVHRPVGPSAGPRLPEQEPPSWRTKPQFRPYSPDFGD